MTVEGVVPPVVTPFGSDGELDEDGLRAEVRLMLSAGADGVCVGGSTGDGHTLSLGEAGRLVRIAKETAGDVPVVAGIIRNSTAEVIAYGKALKDAGADALQITPVHYLFTSGESATLRYYEEIGDAVQLPIVVYNVIPWNTLGPATLLRLDELEWVVAVKQSGGDIHKLADLLRAIRVERRSLRVLTALDDVLYPSFALGAHGVISASSSAFPRLVVQLWNAVRSGDHATALALHERILPVWRSLDHPDLPARMRTVLELQDRVVGPPRAPIAPSEPAVRELIAHRLEASGLLPHPINA